MEPTGYTDHDVLTSTPVLATVDSFVLATSDVHPVVLDRVGSFKTSIDRVQPFLKGVITRASPSVSEPYHLGSHPMIRLQGRR